MRRLIYFIEIMSVEAVHIHQRPDGILVWMFKTKGIYFSSFSLPCFVRMKIYFDHVLYMLLLAIYMGKLSITRGKFLSIQALNRRLYLFVQLMPNI